MMQIYRFGLALTWLNAFVFTSASVPNSIREVYNVAIIGAGPAGSSAAYWIGEDANAKGIAINVTIFEKTDRIGGRTLTVDAFNDASIPVELGASIFVGVNSIMNDAVKRYDLSLKDAGRDEGDITCIWDGENIVYQTTKGTTWLWDAASMIWRYGLSPMRAKRLVDKTVQTFLRLYEEPYFPFRSLTQRAYELGLEKLTGITGEQLIADNAVSPAFGREIIQTATRVNYASNLAYIHGLEAMVSMATDGAHQVEGGNWRIFHQMVRDSGAAVYRNTSVSHISVVDNKDPSSARSKYAISTKKSGSDTAAAEEYPISFNKIVIANPWQYSDITAGQGVLKHKIDEVPYMKLHVTLFTSPFTLRPGFFNLPDGSKAPSTVYTTLKPADEAKQGPDGAGSAGFYSISTLATVTNPKTGKREFLYKIFSPEAVTSKFLTDILGASIPETFTSEAKPNGAASETVDPISWYYPHWFHAYPILLPRVTFQDTVVGDGLYYTSGMESFISCMETAALMGKNVARLIVDDFEATAGDFKIDSTDDGWDMLKKQEL
jgi:prenylcysteine oxidase/farnesylcysteine lyase